MKHFAYLLVVVLTGYASLEAQSAPPKVTHGPMAGDVTSESAIVWARADGAATLHFTVGSLPEKRVSLSPTNDYAGEVHFTGLTAGTPYEYRVWIDGSEPLKGSFRTAPPPQGSLSVRFAWGGDIGGHNVCRDAQEGYPIFSAIEAQSPDFFVGLGNLIFGDHVCEGTGAYGNAQVPGRFPPSTDLNGYWSHWRYTLGEDRIRKLLASTGFYGIWDDHEVVTACGPASDTRDEPPYKAGLHLLPIGRAAYQDYSPIATPPSEPNRLYRSFRWGKHLELFLLDTRQYRDANSQPDKPGAGKTMLGGAQLKWLLQSLAASDATWKIIASSVPLSLPAGAPSELGHDGWANFDQPFGYENELRQIFDFLAEHKIVNHLWISTDSHFAEAIRLKPIAGKPEFLSHEVVTGPLQAAVDPVSQMDQTFQPERLFSSGPQQIPANVTWEKARQLMNYGWVEIDGDGKLRIALRNIEGKVLWELALTPQ